ncbi:Wadjet anti-phage system protein JetD domain-containing protein [Marispirochaeta sp.]|uniref:Wadjet anti-phage system protein JetD domain-containing protein n=1 Tax=Marispirochaeta sp. TaxID=2038653 RepID=UPI0029C6AB2F|nr:Wadjet anti-phage system protein JetD domain-containing protein [Marispirochaeta sp.]
MISPEELRNKLLTRYPEFLKTLVTGKSVFPYRPRINLKIDFSQYNKAVRQIRSLEAQAKAQKGFGYIIEFETIRTRKFGTQTRPKTIYFETQKDFFRFIRKETETAAFIEAIELTRKTFSLPDRWICENISIILRYLEKWPDIISTAHQLAELHTNTDLSGLNRRSLPVSLDSKFIERNKTPIQKILEETGKESLDLDSPIYSSDFLVWMRFYESAYSFYNADMGIFPVEEISTMELPVDRILIIENKACFIRPLPLLVTSKLKKESQEETLLIWGQGNACQRLKEVPWLMSKSLYYWGDMDLHGLAILGRFRRIFPHTLSIGMDFKTYSQHKQYAVRSELLDRGSWYDYLSMKERELSDYLIAHPEKSRIEQERIQDQ